MALLDMVEALDHMVAFKDTPQTQLMYFTMIGNDILLEPVCTRALC